MEILEGFEEIRIDGAHSEMKLPILHVELSFTVRYFMNNEGAGYSALIIKEVKGKGLRGTIEAAAGKTFIGRTILVFLSELENGKKLITVPSLFEKEPSFNDKLDMSELIINTYYHDEFKKTEKEVYKEHMKALTGEIVNNDHEKLRSSLLELPVKGIEILRSIK
ncbi:MAG: hypothetical protein J5U17_01595 [Candidatus Methanoperedens sp.]|nr:hypothetical protein [Candidatus Methanoperedens sp.]MCE8426991.1 hypothetical protein [Candidatus Methanoperedens sp.]